MYNTTSGTRRDLPLLEEHRGEFSLAGADVAIYRRLGDAERVGDLLARALAWPLEEPAQVGDAEDLALAIREPFLELGSKL